jgi:hypothetical protein
MLLTMMIILAFTSCALELMIAAKVPAWRRLSAKYPLFNLVNSLVISFIMGISFGAAGLVAMGAGVISTILSVPGYQLLHWNFDSPTAAAHGGNMYLHYKANFKVEYVKWKQVMIDFAKVIYLILRTITAPIWICRSVAIKLKRAINQFVNRNVPKSTGTVP